MKIHNFEQGSPDWYAIRKGKMTASNACAIGNNGKGLDTYITELMAEYFSSGQKEQYTNKDIERGRELEEYARKMYELETGEKIQQVGFCEMSEFVGCSPDGLIGEDGGIEIKSLNDINHFKIILNGEGEIESKYLWQIQMNLLVTERKWWIYCSYNPNFSKSLLLAKILPDEEMHSKLREGLKRGEEKIKEILSKFST